MLNASVIIPIFNEKGNIKPLIQRIHTACMSNNVQYEIICIDDFSTDNSFSIIQNFVKQYPIILKTKKGKKGKAQCLIEGFHYAKYPVVAMIDADLQYPPEALVPMVNAVYDDRYDVVVANRSEQQISFLRQCISTSFRWFFGKYLHGFNVDVQSGLKVFRKEILERITLTPTAWTFDLEFLVKSRDAGYRIGSFDIVFSKRFSGKSKVNLLKTSFEIGVSALKLKMQDPQIIPFSYQKTQNEGSGFHFKGKKFLPYSSLFFFFFSFYTLTTQQVLLILTGFIFFAVGLWLNWHTTIVFIIAFVTIIYFIDLLFNLLLILKAFIKKPEIRVLREEIERIQDNNWPSYTIFCPLYKEWSVLPQFITAIERLEYPKNKLQVLLLLEEDDRETIEQVKKYTLPSYLQVIIVPHSLPKTKPKALNYGLLFAKGRYCVVYDAEDIPDRLQLKKAVLAFQKSQNNTICIQAKLNFYNPHQNVLTKIFTLEYSLWFDLVLTGIQSLKGPIPLGGTSNHFRTENLKTMEGWDAFNVTEDCDLGIRIAKKGYRTAIIDSITLEEANSEFVNWFRQRTRWIKGYIQTYLVHLRDHKRFVQEWGIIHAASFHLIVGGKILCMFVNPLLWGTTIVYFAFRGSVGNFIETFFPSPILYMGAFSLVFGNFLYLYYYMIGCVKRRHYSLVKFAFLVPFYWLAMSAAATISVYETIINPHYWAKTVHGFHLQNKSTVTQAVSIIGQKLIDQRYSRYPSSPNV